MKGDLWVFNKNNDYDNHIIPQYKFVTDENGNLIENIKIFKTESLTDELKEYGLFDYYTRENVYWVLWKHFPSPAKYFEIESIDQNKTLIKQYSPDEDDMWIEISQYLDTL